MRSLRTIGFGLSFLPVMACGGTAVVENGSGGAGGTGASSTGQVATSTGPGSSSVSTGQTSTSNSTVSSTSSGPMTSSSSGPSDCDGTGNCGDSSTGCIACAISGACASLYDACASDQACIDFAGCISQCPQPPHGPCLDDCLAAAPEGGALYLQLIDCVACQQCAMDCASTGFWNCAAPPPGG